MIHLVECQLPDSYEPQPAMPSDLFWVLAASKDYYIDRTCRVRFLTPLAEAVHFFRSGAHNLGMFTSHDIKKHGKIQWD